MADWAEPDQGFGQSFFTRRFQKAFFSPIVSNSLRWFSPVILDLGPLLQTFLAATSPIYHFPFSQTLNMGKILDLSKNAIHVKDCFSLVGFRAASYNNTIGRAFSILFGEKKFCASWNFAIVSRFHHLRYWRWRRYDILDWNSTLMQRWSRSRGCQREFPLSKFFFLNIVSKVSKGN